MSLWVDKYRPNSLQKLDYHKSQAAHLKNLVSSGSYKYGKALSSLELTYYHIDYVIAVSTYLPTYLVRVINAFPYLSGRCRPNLSYQLEQQIHSFIINWSAKLKLSN